MIFFLQNYLLSIFFIKQFQNQGNHINHCPESITIHELEIFIQIQKITHILTENKT